MVFGAATWLGYERQNIVVTVVNPRISVDWVTKRQREG